MNPSVLRYRYAAPLRRQWQCSRIYAGRSYSTEPSPARFIPSVETCECDSSTITPLPDNLEIDTTSRLAGNITRQSRTLLICTGRNDWKTKIDFEPESLAAKVKAMIGKGGKFCDPFNNIMIANISPPIDPLPTSDVSKLKPYDPSNPSKEAYSSAFILSGQKNFYFPYIPHDPPKLLEDFIAGHLIPTTHEIFDVKSSHLHRLHFRSGLKSRVFNIPSREPLHEKSVDKIEHDTILVMICGHGERDRRCGVLGPLIEASLKDHLKSMGLLEETWPTPAVANGNYRVMNEFCAMWDWNKAQQEPHPPPYAPNTSKQQLEAYRIPKIFKTRVGMISHMGGHKFAGNLIIYLPGTHPLSVHINKGLVTKQYANSPQRPQPGVEIWYGRVKPEHTKGIIEQTLVGGKVIKGFLRGIVDGDGKIITDVGDSTPTVSVDAVN